MKKLLSVIIPVYNSEKYLSRCLDSIINQKYQNLEIIIVDDGSIDNSSSIYKEYANTDSRIKIYKQENQGVAVARNKGLDLATGDYITFVDSDDYISEDMYSTMMEKINKYSVDVVMCDCLKLFNDKQEIYTHNIREGYYDRVQLENEYFKNLFIMPNIEYPPTISNWVIIFKNKPTTPRYIEGVKYSEDLYFGAQLMYDADSFYYLKNVPLYYYDCTNIESATHKFNEKKWEGYKKIYYQARNDFGMDKTFDNQINLMLLFFVYNYISDIYKIKEQYKDKEKMILDVLSDKDVKYIFSTINIKSLLISKKLKLITFAYKYRIGLKFLIKNFERKS